MQLEKIQFRRMLYPPGHLLGCAQDATVLYKSIWILLVCKYGLGEILYPNLFAGSDVITQSWRHCYYSLPYRSKMATQVFFPPCANNKCWNIPQQGGLSGGCVTTMQRVPLVLISPRLARNQMTEGRENHLLPYLCLKLNRKWGLKFWVTFCDMVIFLRLRIWVEHYYRKEWRWRFFVV